MAVAPTLPVKVVEADEAGSRSASFRRRLAGVGVRGRDLILVACLLMVVGFVHAWNMSGYPGFITDDEGTYTAQAWAVLNRGALAHYAYTYDHPPLGWILIAGYAWLTDAFDRVTPSVLVGREAMLLVNLVSCALLYVLARRLRLHRVAAGGAVLLFGLSPLAVHFHRMVFLDNLSVMWALAAFVLAAAPRRGRTAAGGCAACFAAAVLSKETALLLLPAVIWLLVQNTADRSAVDASSSSSGVSRHWSPATPSTR